MSLSRTDPEAYDEAMNEQSDAYEIMTNVIACMVSIEQKKRETLKYYGFKTYKAFEEAKTKTLSILPEAGVLTCGYRVIRTDRVSFITKMENAKKIITPKLSIHEER